MAKTYQETLAQARRVGARNASDAELMALFCADSLQIIAGAVSPRLVWEGAQAKGMTARELSTMATRSPLKVHDLMW